MRCSGDSSCLPGVSTAVPCAEMLHCAFPHPLCILLVTFTTQGLQMPLSPFC